MRNTFPLAAIALLAAAVGASALAGERDHDRRHDHQQSSDARSAADAGLGMQVVPNNAGPQDRAQGWRYFSDPEARRAVVISPHGDYYLSLGEGLRWVAGAQA
ncbi:MAG: hypothetical protein JSR43_00885 [Proteobacteria bacterium]|nr:hypothetical protein [Pseudomonadota bacterium]